MYWARVRIPLRPLMKIKYAELDCTYGSLGALVDCYPRICILCPWFKPMWFKEVEVTPFQLRDIIASYRYVIKV